MTWLALFPVERICISSAHFMTHISVNSLRVRRSSTNASRLSGLSLARKAGADEVVSPGKLAGFLLADAVDSRYTTRFITDVLTSRTSSCSGVASLASTMARTAPLSLITRPYARPPSAACPARRKSPT